MITDNNRKALLIYRIEQTEKCFEKYIIVNQKFGQIISVICGKT